MVRAALRAAHRFVGEDIAPTAGELCVVEEKGQESRFKFMEEAVHFNPAGTGSGR